MALIFPYMHREGDTPEGVAHRLVGYGGGGG